MLKTSATRLPPGQQNAAADRHHQIREPGVDRQLGQVGLGHLVQLVHAGPRHIARHQDVAGVYALHRQHVVRPDQNVDLGISRLLEHLL